MRTERLELRLTPDELAAIDHRRGDLSRSQYIRVAAVGRQPDPPSLTHRADGPEPPVQPNLLEQGRRLASERDDLIANGVDPSELHIPLAPPGEHTHSWHRHPEFTRLDVCACGEDRPHQTGTK